MASQDVYIALVDGVAELQKLDGTKIGRIELEWQETITLKIRASFANSPSISKVTIYNWADYGKPNKVAVGAWTSGNKNVGVLNIQPAATGSDVILMDADEGTTDGDYGYEVTVTDGGLPYTADPELLAKKKRPTTGGTDAATSSTPPTPEAGA